MTQGAIRRSHKRYIGWDILQIVNRSDYIAHSILRLFKDVLEKIVKRKMLAGRIEDEARKDYPDKTCRGLERQD